MARRSLDDINLTPEEEAFLQHGNTPTSKPVSKQKPKPKTQKANPPLPLTVSPSEQPTPPSPNPPPNLPAHDSLLVSLNTRVPNDLATELLRVSMGRKLRKVHPFSQQDIVIEALSDWLKKNDPMGEADG